MIVVFMWKINGTIMKPLWMLNESEVKWNWNLSGYGRLRMNPYKIKNEIEDEWKGESPSTKRPSPMVLGCASSLSCFQTVPSWISTVSLLVQYPSQVFPKSFTCIPHTKMDILSEKNLIFQANWHSSSPIDLEMWAVEVFL